MAIVQANLANDKASVRWSWVAAVALVPAVVKVICYPNNIGSDDAYIHLRVAENFARGLGWGINPHEPVNLSSSPGFTLLVAAAERWTKHGVGVMQVLSCAAVAVGLVLLYLAVASDTGSKRAGLFAEFTAAFSVNLWRWNGALMEATFGFAAVAATLYLFRRDADRGWLRVVSGGVVLGVCVMLRPEIGMLAMLAFFVQMMRSTSARRWRDAILLAVGMAIVLMPWCWFAVREFGSAIPTTFAAKSSSRLIFVNEKVSLQFAKSIAESILFPLLLVLVLVVWRGQKPVRRSAGHADLLRYVIPVGWVAGLFAFYYLKTPALQSTGRYVLPLLPCQAAILGLVWGEIEDRFSRSQLQFAAGCVAAQVVFALTLNAVVITPVLRRFEAEYGATMRAAADEAVLLTAGSANRRVLVETDIGAFSCEADGRIEIIDGGALATPSLRGLSLRDQMQQTNPAYVVQSLAPVEGGMGPGNADLLDELWERRFRQHGVSESIPYYYTVIFHAKKDAQLAAR